MLALKQKQNNNLAEHEKYKQGIEKSVKARRPFTTGHKLSLKAKIESLIMQSPFNPVKAEAASIE